MTHPPRLALLLLSLAACRSGRSVEAGALATEVSTARRPEPAAPDTQPDAAPVSAPPPEPAACDAPCDRDEACAVVTPPDCGACVAVLRDRRSERACAAWGCRATTCDTSAWRARCDGQARRCVLVEAAPR